MPGKEIPSSRRYIGARLRQAREEAGLSQREIAKRANMRHASWLAIEKGRTKLDFADIEKYGKLLGKPAHWFLPPGFIDPTGLDPEVARLAERINNLPDEVRQAFEKLVEQAVRASGLLKDEEEGRQAGE